VPTYQYACTVCDERLEAVQSFTDAPLKQCPVCGGALRKVFSAVGVVFKGSGFYRNDSRDAPNKEREKKEPAPAAAGASCSPEGGSSGKGAEGNTSAGKDAGGKSSSSSSDGGSKADGNSSGGKPSTAKPAASGKPAERKSA